MTFSIIAKCAETGQIGVAAVTAMPAVGKLVTHARPRVGAVATQARLNPYLGIDGLALLGNGLSADQVFERLCAGDPGLDARQFAVMDYSGQARVWTGQDCIAWAGQIAREGFCTQGNRLAGAHVLEAVADTFEKCAGQPLADRFLEALASGVGAGGDTEGEVSANIYIMAFEEYPLWDIRVDSHEDPIAELRRLHAIFRVGLLPEIERMPTRSNPAGQVSEGTA
jgi:uncharacterized Ntn-hydrolase superfamily protein